MANRSIHHERFFDTYKINLTNNSGVDLTGQVLSGFYRMKNENRRHFFERSHAPSKNKFKLFSRCNNLEDGFYFDDGRSISEKIRINDRNATKLQVLSNLQRDERFIQDFKQAKKLIDSNRVSKVVVYNSLEIICNRNIIPEDFIKNSPAQKVYECAYWGKEFGAYFQSPEILLLAELGAQNNYYETISLAGTTYNNDNPLESQALKKEQLLVTQHFKSLLNKHQINIELESPKIMEYGRLKHISQTIKFQSEHDFHEMIHILNPTPAVGFAPKYKLMGHWGDFEFNHHSDFNRYGGVFCVENEHMGLGIVMIRGVQWNLNKMWIHAGCGIHADSLLEEELEESTKKIEQVKTNLNLCP
jgi:isochorismate synthase EntC